jgi:hypothetical protein
MCYLKNTGEIPVKYREIVDPGHRIPGLIRSVSACQMGPGPLEGAAKDPKSKSRMLCRMRKEAEEKKLPPIYRCREDPKSCDGNNEHNHRACLQCCLRGPAV